MTRSCLRGLFDACDCHTLLLGMVCNSLISIKGLERLGRNRIILEIASDQWQRARSPHDRVEQTLFGRS